MRNRPCGRTCVMDGCFVFGTLARRVQSSLLTVTTLSCRRAQAKQRTVQPPESNGCRVANPVPFT